MIKNHYQRIRDLREDRDWTQTQIAEMLHVTQKVHSNYETGRTPVPTPILVELANIHGTSTDYLVERTDSPYFKKMITGHPQKDLL